MPTRMVRVYNDHHQDYKENFRDSELIVPAKGYVEMEDSEATLFMGKFPGLRRDGRGHDITIKMLRKVYVTPEMTQTETAKCMACGTEFKTASELEVHSKVHEAQKVKDEPQTKKKFFS